MRRLRNFFISIPLCALALGGWGGVLAAALCPHGMRASATESPQRTNAHASCHAESTEAVADRSNAPEHEAMDNMAAEAVPQTEEASQTSASRAFATPLRSCWLCIGHSNLPVAPVNPRETQQNEREATQAAAKDIKLFAPPDLGFVRAVLPVQGSPPGQQKARHLLLNIFII